MFSPLEYSVIGRARQKGILEINIVDIRDFSADKHKKCDDYPFGGGAGMVMMPQPVHDCVNAVDPDRQALRIYLSPKGEKLTQKKGGGAFREGEIAFFLCGHYEGVDQRVLDLIFRLRNFRRRLCAYGRRAARGDACGRCCALRSGSAGKRRVYCGGELFFGAFGISSVYASANIRGIGSARKCLFRDITPMWQNGEWNGSWK